MKLEKLAGSDKNIKETMHCIKMLDFILKGLGND